jgi:hypothetical protein
MRLSLTITLAVCGVMCLGCGTTRWSDTSRTATEQLLLSDATDRAISQLDFRAVAGKTVYLDSTPVKYTTDASYLVSSLRQHMLADGVILMDGRDQADYIVELRAGVIGTDRRELLFGVPASKIPAGLPIPGAAAAIPEISLATKTEQRGVAKIAVFAYNRKTGRPVWQSGTVPIESTAKDIWVFGAGPFQRGTIYDGTEFAGQAIKFPLFPAKKKKPKHEGLVSVADEAFFSEPKELLALEGEADAPSPAKDAANPQKPATGVVQAGHTEASPPKPAPPPTDAKPLGSATPAAAPAAPAAPAAASKPTVTEASPPAAVAAPNPAASAPSKPTPAGPSLPPKSATPRPVADPYADLFPAGYAPLPPPPKAPLLPPPPVNPDLVPPPPPVAPVPPANLPPPW